MRIITVVVVVGLAMTWRSSTVLAQTKEKYPAYLPTAIGQYVPGPAIEIHQNLSDQEWPQLGNTPQRTNYSPMPFNPPQGRLKWSVRLTDLNLDNKIAGPVQAIVGGGKVYVGCKNGRMLALDAKTGEVKWTFQGGGPIMHTAAYAAGKLFFPCMDGCVYALDAESGKLAWKFESGRWEGFATAILLAENLVFAVDAGGRLFALNPADGRKLWHYDAEAPVDQSPAWNAGRIYFASEDMRVHAIKTTDGSRIWRSEKLAGISFRWFHPVVTGGKVLVSAMGYGPHLADYHNPEKRALFALDEDTGKESLVLAQWVTGHDGTQPPPAVTRDGLLVIPWASPETMKDTIYNVHMGWALQDLHSGAIVLPLLENQRRPMVFSGGQRYTGYFGLVAADENMAATVVGDLVIAIHHSGFRNSPSTDMTGAFHIPTRQWHTRHDDGKAGWLTTTSACESGGTNPVSAAGGLLFHHAVMFDTITCHEPAPAK